MCILTQYWPPELGAPQGRLSELGERLIDLGWQVEVLTALPNYPTGRIFDGYARARVTVETVGRIRTARVPLLPSQRGFVRRLICYLSFAGTSAALGPRLCARPELLWVESPPLFIGLAARVLTRRWRCPYVFNVSDLWPESAVRLGMVGRGTLTHHLAERYELTLYRGAAGITAQSLEIIGSVRARVPNVPTELVTNGVDTTRFGRHLADDWARALIGPEDGPVAIYAGLFGHAQGLEQILALAASLPPELPGRFVLVGDGPLREALAQRITAERIPRVRLLPPVSRDRVPALLAAADIAIVPLGARLPGAVPSKIYEAMASQLPVLLVADGEAADRIEQAGCGLTSSPGDDEALRANFERLARDPDLRARLGLAGRHAAATIYDRTAIARRLDDFLRSCLQSGSARQVR
ncbi:MAG TPA: glycosyltransferase family 4 protein [Gaiellaceae bacterium]|nr:glycosyltransferase family 4 protein [Gaiellaceae bacterium]